MTDYYVPGAEEKDPKKVIYSLQQAHEKTATNAADISALQAAASDYLTKTGNLAGLNSTSTSQTNLGGTTVGKAVFTAASQGAARLAIGAGAPDAIIEDQKTTGTSGGTFTAATVTRRNLNTLVRNIAGMGVNSLTSNQFELSAGTYYITWSAPAWKVDQHQTWLRNAATAVLGIGTSEYAPNGTNSAQSRSFGSAVVILGSTTTLEIVHYGLVTQATNGLGLAVSISGLYEVYTRVEIWRLA